MVNPSTVDSAAPGLRVLALSLYGPLAASTRHRISYYIPELAAAGIHVDVAPFLDDAYLQRRFADGGISLAAVGKGYLQRMRQLLGQGRYDCAWVQGELSPLLPGWLDRAMLRIPYVYDFDDAYYLKYALRGGCGWRSGWPADLRRRLARRPGPSCRGRWRAIAGGHQCIAISQRKTD